MLSRGRAACSPAALSVRGPAVSRARPRCLPGSVVCPAASSIRSLSSATHPKVARNLTRSFFDVAHKRCNSNDPISMFEIITRELRATLLRNHETGTNSADSHPKVARNLTRSILDIAHKRCNSNDSISIFEIIPRELRATLLRNHETETKTGRRIGTKTGTSSADSHPKVARNLTRSFFDIAHKRCNSNDSISMFEIIARELRATLLRNHSVEPQSRRTTGGARGAGGTPGARRAAAYQAITRPLRRVPHQPARPTRPAATAR